MPHFLHKFSVLFRYCKKQILYRFSMERTGGGTSADDFFQVKENDGAVRYCCNVIEQGVAFGSDIGLAEHFTRGNLTEYASVSPIIVVLNKETALNQNENIT